MKFLSPLFIVIAFFLFFTPYAFALEDPRSLPNNKVGIHILFPSEITDAAKLVNSSGGDWGYVIIPIQSGDKDLIKWQNFMDLAKSLHVIPIIRLATEGDYFNTKVWRKPNPADVLDFANFLSSLDWPTKNRYVVVYNEVNRGDEWGGTPSAIEYANLLSYAVTVFKLKSEDFFIITAGLDNASINTSESMNEYTFLSEMNAAVPGIFNQVDGIGSHSYPNPAFSQPPSSKGPESINSFIYEKQYIDSVSSKDHPVFITETGWSKSALPESTIVDYFQTAFSAPWANQNVVAVTPFLLRAGAGSFQQFSFFNEDGSQGLLYKSLYAMQKTQGKPSVTQTVLSAHITNAPLPVKDFSSAKLQEKSASVPPTIRFVLKWFYYL